MAGSWCIRYLFGKGTNFSSPNSLLHVANKLFFEVAELISDNLDSDFALCIIFTIEFVDLFIVVYSE